MSQKIAKSCLENAVKRFEEANSSELKKWKGYCGCSIPGREIKCHHCPYFLEYLQTLQKNLESNSEKNFAIKLVPNLSPPYSSEIREQCVGMFVNGYSLTKIKALTGVNNLQHIRVWLIEEGLMKKRREYSTQEKEHCIELYLEGMTPVEVEEVTLIPADFISEWVGDAGASRPKTSYSDTQKELALSMYHEGKSYAEIEEATGISKEMVHHYTRKAKVRRKHKKKGGRPSTYSEEFKQTCLSLLEEGKTTSQVEELMGVSRGTVRKWQKKAKGTNKSEV